MTYIGRKRGTWRIWSSADHDRLVAFVREHGEQYEVIAKELGRTVEAVVSHLRKQSPDDVRPKRKSVRIPDLTPAQIAEAKSLRESGYNGKMDLRRIAKAMNVRLVQLNRIFRPQEIERTSYRSEAACHYVPEPIEIPSDVLAERDLAMSRDRWCAAEVLGEPPPGRSALERMRAGLPV